MTFQLYGAVQGAFKILGYNVVAVTGRVGLQGTLGVNVADVANNSTDPRTSSTARSAWG